MGGPLIDVKTWAWRVLIGLDQLGNALTGGEAGETISSRTGRTGLGGLLDRVLNLFQGDHAAIALEYTPWGSVDPHNMPALDGGLKEDWDRLLAVVDGTRAGMDLDAYPAEVLDGADRAQKRLRLWLTTGGNIRWAKRMSRDLIEGERYQ